MRVIVNYDLCTSNGVCMGLAPEVFEVRDDGYMYVLNEQPGPELAEKVRAAVAGCPNGALALADE